MSRKLQALQAKRNRRLKTIGVLTICTAIAVVIGGLALRSRQDEAVKVWTQSQFIPTVKVIHLEHASSMTGLTLPGVVQAYYDAPIYARVPGYLKMWYQDIGARVKKGQVLATIDTPDLDQQLEQAKADLVTARAKLQLAKVTAARWQHLLKQDAVSMQESDEKTDDMAVKTAVVAAAQANVERLQAMEAFKQLTAPFDGIVTARKTDVGDLIVAGGDKGPELFAVADVHKLRVYVSVPQAYSAHLNPGIMAMLTVPEYPGQQFPALMVSSASAVSAQTGTVLVELSLDNTQGRINPGDYAEVHFKVPSSYARIRVPASALIFRAHGLQVATVGADDRAVLKKITIGHDDGAYVEVSSGLSVDDQVIDNPPDSLTNGEKVVVGHDLPSVRGHDHGRG